ncbi:MAG: hypothetical protein AAFO63_04705, partial [Pseudomonadota bacterium]
MLTDQMKIQDLFCATWRSKPSLNRSEIARALNHRSHRRWMLQYLEQKSELLRFNIVVALGIVVLWLRHHINYRVRQIESRAWFASPALAIEHARTAIQHHDPNVREDGLAVLVYFGDTSSLGLIRSLFEHSDPTTRYRAQLAARAIEREMPILFVSPAFTRLN